MSRWGPNLTICGECGILTTNIGRHHSRRRCKHQHIRKGVM